METKLSLTLSPSERPNPVPVPRWLLTLCRISALSGGAILLAMMVMTVVSIVGRALFSAPIPGDFELVELASAIATFCFLPWGQITGGNVRVDVFTSSAGPRATHILEALGDLIYLLVGAVLLWRMIPGAVELRQYADQTMILQVPIWWSFVLILPAMVLLVVTTFFTLRGHVREARQ